MTSSRFLALVSLSALTCACSFGSHDQSGFVAAPTSATQEIQSTIPMSVSAGPMLDVAKSALARGETAAAVSLAKRALDSTPGDRVALQLLAEALLADGQTEDSVAAFKALLALDANDAAAHAGLGMALLANGDPTAAKTELEKAIAAKPTDAVKTNIGLALALAGDPSAAVKVLEPVAFSQSGSALSRQNLALALTLSGDRAKAYSIAAMDMGIAPAVRQVDTWYAAADKPLPEQLKQFAGLNMKSTGFVKVTKLASTPVAPKAAEAVAVQSIATPVAGLYEVAALQPTQSASVAAVAVATITTVVKPISIVPAVLVQAEKPAAPVNHKLSSTDALPSKPISILPVTVASVLPTQVTVIKPSQLSMALTHSALGDAKLERASMPSKVVAPFAQAKSRHTGFTSMTSYTATHITSGWFVQVAAVAAELSNVSIKNRLSQQFHNVLAKISLFSTYDAQVGNKQIKRVMMGPYVSQASAAKICNGIKAKGHGCFIRSVMPAKVSTKI